MCVIIAIILFKCSSVFFLIKLILDSNNLCPPPPPTPKFHHTLSSPACEVIVPQFKVQPHPSLALSGEGVQCGQRPCLYGMVRAGCDHDNLILWM